MIGQMEKNTIITLKLRGMSERAIARETGLNRKTVARYWKEYLNLTKQLEPGGENREIQEQIVSAPIYKTSERKLRKYTEEIDKAIDALLESEKEKARRLGENNKQKLTNRQIHGLLRAEGHDIGLTMVTIHLKEKRSRTAEAFIRQEYGFGDRLEYDFGEVKLVINGETDKYYLAVLGCPGSSFRRAYLYSSRKKDAFPDSHVRFFEMTGGSYREVVCDNMKNAVTRFTGKNEKELNSDLIAMSAYCGFSVNVTSCFSGNGKGYVESSVKAVRKDVFAVRHRFDSMEDAGAYPETELMRMNKDSLIEQEMKHLLPFRPPLELSGISQQRADKYSFVRAENNFYSVPEYLAGRTVTVRRYIREIVVYSGLNEVCRHKRKDGFGEMSVNILHYLDTLIKKPGAVRSSGALKSETGLKAVFDKYYTTRVREFTDILRMNQDKPMDEIVRVMQMSGEGFSLVNPKVTESNILNCTRSDLGRISDFFMKGRASNGN